MVRWAIALLLPMAGYVLLIDRPHLDVSWENHRAHFWLVLVGRGRERGAGVPDERGRPSGGATGGSSSSGSPS
jgi:hypothetical protein